MTTHQEIAEQIIDETLATITYTTTAEQQIAILTELGRRLQLVQLTGNFVPEGGVIAATDQELAYKKNLEAEKRRLEEENERLRQQLEEVLRSAPVQ